MTNYITFRSDHGDIKIQVDDEFAEQARRVEAEPAEQNTWVPKGVKARSKGGGKDTEIETKTEFNDAIQSLGAYANSLQDVIGGIRLTPREVSVEIGMKLTGSAGFIIASAKGEADMRITLTWEPGSKPAADAT